MYFYNFQILGAIEIPYVQDLINLTNDSIHCIDQRSLDAKAIVTM